MAVYLDHNATTPVDRRVVEAMLPFLQEHFGNPSSVYRRGRLARQSVEMARERVAQLVNVQPSQVIFTSGGTEANNLAVRSSLSHSRCLAVSAVEHASVLEPAKDMSKAGGDLHVIDVDGEGMVCETSMKEALSKLPSLVSVMMANNETGVVQDIERLASLTKAHGVIFHTDAVQAAGKMALDFSALGTQMMSLSAHKLYGPKGVGALILDSRVELPAQMLGGGHENAYRSGTENVAGIVGFGRAAELALSELSDRSDAQLRLRKSLESKLAMLNDVVVFAQAAKRLPNTVFMAIPGIDGEALLMELDRLGIEVSSGSACDSQKVGPSHVLTAMGVDDALARCAVRISLGQDNTEADVEALVLALKQQVEILQSNAMVAWV
ncbi:cysteine desulfurase family protein [Pseudomonadota bacterium]